MRVNRSAKWPCFDSAICNPWCTASTWCSPRLGRRAFNSVDDYTDGEIAPCLLAGGCQESGVLPDAGKLFGVRMLVGRLHVRPFSVASVAA